MIIFLKESTYCDLSSELSCQDVSDEGSQHMVLCRINKNFLAYRIRISTCFTWTDNSYLTHVFSPGGRIKITCI